MDYTEEKRCVLEPLRSLVMLGTWGVVEYLGIIIGLSGKSFQGIAGKASIGGGFCWLSDGGAERFENPQET